MSWRGVVGLSVAFSMLSVSGLVACSSTGEAGDGGTSGEAGGGGGAGSLAPGTGGGDLREAAPLESPDSGAGLPMPPYACTGAHEWRSWEFSPLPWGSMASAEYARVALATGALPNASSLSLDDFLARFAPVGGNAPAVAGGLFRSDVTDPLRAQLDVTLYPASSELAAPATHLIVVVDASQGMLEELLLAAKVLRGLGTSLDAAGDELSVVRWSASSELVVERSGSPADAADGAAAALEATASQLPPSADLSAALGVLAGLVDGRAAHVVLLTDGGSPVGSDAVARLREEGAVVSVIQLVGASRAGETLPFAGGVLRSVALEGRGAALWVHEGETDLAYFESRFDAIFRRTSAPRLSVSTPYALDIPTGSSGDVASLDHGVGAPLRVVVDADVCSAEFYTADLGEAFWGSFAVAGATASYAIEPASRAQLQWVAARRIFDVLSEGCPTELPTDFVEFPGLTQPDASHPDVLALVDMAADLRARCVALNGGNLPP